MKFKVGDIVRFTGEKFKDFMYEKDHIVLAVGEDQIKTRGKGWCYTEHGSNFQELFTNKDRWDDLEIVNTNSWKGSILKFSFINTDAN